MKAKSIVNKIVIVALALGFGATAAFGVWDYMAEGKTGEVDIDAMVRDQKVLFEMVIGVNLLELQEIDKKITDDDYRALGKIRSDMEEEDDKFYRIYEAMLAIKEEGGLVEKANLVETLRIVHIRFKGYFEDFRDLLLEKTGILLRY